MATTTITTNYRDPATIPPRCRKPRPMLQLFTGTFTITEVTPADLTLALTFRSEDYWRYGNHHYIKTRVHHSERITAITTGTTETTEDELNLWGIHAPYRNSAEHLSEELPEGDVFFEVGRYYNHSEPTPTTAKKTQAFFAKKAGQLLLCEGIYYRLAPTPYLHLDVSDTDLANKVVHKKSSWEEESAMYINPAFVRLTNEAPGINRKEHVWQVLPLTDYDRALKEIAKDAQTVTNPSRTRAQAEEHLQELWTEANVTIHDAEALTLGKASPQWLPRTWRLKRIRHQALLDALYNAHARHGHLLERWEVQAWEREAAQIAADFQQAGYSLYATKEEFVDVGMNSL